MNKSTKNYYLEKVEGALFRRHFYKYLPTLLTIYLSCIFSSVFSAVVVSEVFVDTTTNNIQYVELTNINNKNQKVNLFEFSNGNTSVYVNDTVSFAPHETKIMMFSEFILPDSSEIDSSKLIFSNSSLRMYDILLMTLDSTVSDTFFVKAKVAGCTERNNVLVDEEFGIVSSDFRDALPSPLKGNMNVRMKKVLAYTYDNSGNRLKSASKIVYEVKGDEEIIEEKEPVVPEIVIEDDRTHPRFQVYPNPTNGDVIVEMPETGDYTIKLFNLRSVSLLTEEIVKGNTAKINMTDLATGIYMVTVYRGSEVFGTVKIIKK